MVSCRFFGFFQKIEDLHIGDCHDVENVAGRVESVIGLSLAKELEDLLNEDAELLVSALPFIEEILLVL